MDKYIRIGDFYEENTFCNRDDIIPNHFYLNESRKRSNNTKIRKN